MRNTRTESAHADLELRDYRNFDLEEDISPPLLVHDTCPSGTALIHLDQLSQRNCWIVHSQDALKIHLVLSTEGPELPVPPKTTIRSPTRSKSAMVSLGFCSFSLGNISTSL